MKRWLFFLGVIIFLAGCSKEALVDKAENGPFFSAELMKEGLKGKVKEVTITTEENGQAMRVEIISFSPKGQKKRTIYRNQNEPEKIIIYDEKGRIKSQEEVEVEKIEYNYDEKNNKFKALRNGKEYISGKLDPETKKISLRQESNLDYYFYYDQKGNETTRETYQDNKIKMRVATFYDEKDREKLNEISLFWDEKGPISSRKEFTYKDDWVVEKKILSNSMQEAMLSFTYLYENLDSKGNWQKRITKNSENKHELTDICQITYYE